MSISVDAGVSAGVSHPKKFVCGVNSMLTILIDNKNTI